MLNVSNHQRDADQNHSKISSHTAKMAVINTSTNNKCWRGCGKNGTLSALLVGMPTGAATMESCTEFSQKIKNGSAFGSSDSTAGNISKES